MRKALLLGATALVSMVAAPANAVVVFLDSVVAEGDLFRWTFSGNFADDEGIRTGSQLVIVDFAGFAGGVTTPAIPGLSFTTGNSSLPLFPGYTNDATIEDLIWTYTGDPIDLSGVEFAGLSALSTYGGRTAGSFTSFTQKTNGLGAATQGEIDVPFATAAVPEPAAWAMMIAGFGLVGSSLRRNRGMKRVIA